MPTKQSSHTEQMGTWGPELTLHSRASLRQGTQTWSTVANAESVISDDVERTSKRCRSVRFKSSLRPVAVASPAPGTLTIFPSPGYFTGTWAYHPYGSASTASTAPITPAITASPKQPAEEDKATKAKAESEKKEPLAHSLPLKAVCSACDQEEDNIQWIKELGYICSGCLAHNTRRM